MPSDSELSKSVPSLPSSFLQIPPSKLSGNLDEENFFAVEGLRVQGDVTKGPNMAGPVESFSPDEGFLVGLLEKTSATG